MITVIKLNKIIFILSILKNPPNADEGGPADGRSSRRAREPRPGGRVLGRGQADAGRPAVLSR